MPITPYFTLSQTDSHIIIDISVPHVRVSLDSMHMALSESNRRLHWSCPPYLLVLTFEQSFHETAAEQAEADTEASLSEVTATSTTNVATYHPTIQNGILRLSLAKAEPGISWTDLDLLGKLMPTKQDTRQPKSQWIQQVTETGTSPADDNDNTHDDALSAKFCLPQHGYGFLRLFHGIFVDWTRDGLAKEMYEGPWPEEDAHDHSTTTDSSDAAISLQRLRRLERRQVEQEAFDEERYFQDMECQDDYLYMSAMAMQPHWAEPDLVDSDLEEDVNNLPDQLQNLTLSEHECGKDATHEMPAYFTQEESIQLASIPYPLLPSIDNVESSALWNGLFVGLVDILFAYVYDHLMTDGDSTVESAWTVSILSASFSWLEDWLDDAIAGDADRNGDALAVMLDSVLLSSTRRSLIYPYLRNLYFSVHVWQQVGQILKRGRRCVIRCLLQVRNILHQSELYYLNNKLFVDPYLAWLQQSHGVDDLDRRLAALGSQIAMTMACPSDDLRDRLELGLADIENRAWAEYINAEEAEEKEFNDVEGDDASDDSVDTSQDGDSSDDDSSDDEAQTDVTSHLLTEAIAHEPLNAMVLASSPVNVSSDLLDNSLGASPLLLSSYKIPQAKSPITSEDSVAVDKQPIIEIIEQGNDS